MLLSVLVVVTIIFIISFHSLTSRLEVVTLNNAYSYIDATARENANSIRANFEHELGLARSLAQSFEDYRSMDKDEVFAESKRSMHGIALNNPNILAVWASWELCTIDKEWTKPYGRERQTYVWTNNSLGFINERLNLDGDTPGLYTQLKENKIDALLDPYWVVYAGTTKNILETSICVPLVDDNRMVCLFGFDFDLSRYQPYIDNISPYQGSLAMLISQNGTIVAHTNKEFIGQNIDSLNIVKGENIKLSEFVFNGKAFSHIVTDSTGTDDYISLTPISVSDIQNTWSLAIIAPRKVIVSEAQEASKRSQTLIIIGLIVLALVVGILMFQITRPLMNVSKVLEVLAQGKIDTKNKLRIKSGDEIEDIGNSVNSLIDSLDKTAKFAQEIGRGNLNVPFEKLSDNDVLGESLLGMRKSLEHSKELDENRKFEEEKERWTNEGIAKFAEILRNNSNSNMEEFAYAVINSIVNYVGANIGGLFLLNSDNNKDKYFELKGCFAYDSRKYENKRIEFGEGLVGRCAKEGETIYMTELPKDYIKISTGLGFDTPDCLLLVPMKLNDEVFGVIELASFGVIKKYKIRFIEKIGESIAATISNVKINIRTAQLLEESRIKSEELSTQEEEMRQNMEELQATQEEAARKTAEMESLINALNTSSYVVEYDLNGTVLSVNQAYVTLTRQSEKNLIGTHHADNIQFTEAQKLNYQKFWNDLQSGIVKKETNKVVIDNNEYTFIETYSPIYDETHQVKKILKIAHNITDFLGDKNKTKK